MLLLFLRSACEQREHRAREPLSAIGGPPEWSRRCAPAVNQIAPTRSA
jgi:hypothetical protein